MADLMLSVMGALVELEPSLRERQREGIPWPSSAAYKGRKRPISRPRLPNWSSSPAAVFRKQSKQLDESGSGGPREEGVRFGLDLCQCGLDGAFDHDLGSECARNEFRER